MMKISFKLIKLIFKDKNLMIYTDGVTEGYLENGEELQVKGLEQELINNKFFKPTEIIEHICQILTKRDAPLRDDVTCIVVSGHNN